MKLMPVLGGLVIVSIFYLSYLVVFSSVFDFHFLLVNHSQHGEICIAVVTQSLCNQMGLSVLFVWRSVTVWALVYFPGSGVLFQNALRRKLKCLSQLVSELNVLK